MNRDIEGWWCDGRSGARRRVRLARGGGQLRLLGLESAAEIARLGFAGLRLTEEVYRGQPIRLAHPDWPDAILTVEDHRLVEWLDADAPRVRRRYLARHATGRRIALWGGALLIVIAVLTLVVPRLMGLLAPAVPVTWAERLGRATVAELAGTRRSCRDPRAQAALDDLVGRLSAGADSPYRFTVRVLHSPVVNAAATAGGHIIIFSGILEAMQTPEELAAVLAHEIAHGIERHPLKAMLRHMGYRLMLGRLSGDAGIGADLVSEAAQLTLERRHSREAEAAADYGAMVLLERAGIDSRGAAPLLRRLAERTQRTAAAPLATHPAWSERIAAAEARQLPGAPALTGSAWQAVKGVCGD